jgi:hypothetical protein
MQSWFFPHGEVFLWLGRIAAAEPFAPHVNIGAETHAVRSALCCMRPDPFGEAWGPEQREEAYTSLTKQTEVREKLPLEGTALLNEA